MQITLKNLAEATQQQIFDQVAEHLLHQNEISAHKKSENGIPGYCSYRGPRGLKCAAGCLIADDEYDPMMDSGMDTSWLDLVKGGVVPPAHATFIRELQILHDTSSVSRWYLSLKTLAMSFSLNTDVLAKHKPVF
ncbi:hypothetical protein [Pseudomonas phage Astolliot]|nr:hypothetical protein [Pseudomonas phage Astolliot]